jgi:hypothetical protein
VRQLDPVRYDDASTACGILSAGCEAAFRHSGLTVFQLQLTKKIDAPPITRDYIRSGGAPAGGIGREHCSGKAALAGDRPPPDLGGQAKSAHCVHNEDEPEGTRCQLAGFPVMAWA